MWLQLLGLRCAAIVLDAAIHIIQKLGDTKVATLKCTSLIVLTALAWHGMVVPTVGYRLKAETDLNPEFLVGQVCDLESLGLFDFEGLCHLRYKQ